MRDDIAVFVIYLGETNTCSHVLSGSLQVGLDQICQSEAPAIPYRAIKHFKRKIEDDIKTSARRYRGESNCSYFVFGVPRLAFSQVDAK